MICPKCGEKIDEVLFREEVPIRCEDGEAYEEIKPKRECILPCCKFALSGLTKEDAKALLEDKAKLLPKINVRLETDPLIVDVEGEVFVVDRRKFIVGQRGAIRYGFYLIRKLEVERVQAERFFWEDLEIKE